MLIVLQIWGGLFYLLNKIFLSLAERKENQNTVGKSRWRIWSWIIYILGVPPWVIVLVYGRNWIAAALEAGGLPAMALGLIIALKGRGREPKWLNYVIMLCIIAGLGYSLYDWRGITTLSQVYELAMVAGFLIGTYEIAKLKVSGYLWFILMNIGCIALMYEQGGCNLLLWQQVLSIPFSIDAYITKKRKANKSRLS